MPIKRITRLIIDGYNNQEKKKQEQRAWEMWIALYPDMIVPRPLYKEPALRFVPFSEFYDKQTARPQSVTSKTKEEILADADMILQSLRKELPEGR